MHRYLYSFTLFILMIVLFPHYFVKMKRRGGYRENFENRFGRYREDLRRRFGTGAILIHAVSVGEVSVADQFMKAMRKDNPHQRFVLSVTSSTGWREAEKRLSDTDVLIYNPLDLPRFVKRALDAIRPSAFIMVETEIWPNMIYHCEKRGIPMCIINGRISDRTAPAYRRLRFLFGPALRAINLIEVQSALDERRYVAAGANPRNVAVTGSFKFDVAARNPALEADVGTLLQRLAFDSPRQILMGASTWDGEESLLLDCYKSLLPRFPSLRLVLAPRHMERGDDVARQIRDAGLRSVRKRDINGGVWQPETLGSNDVLLVDTTGEIMGFYPFTTIAVVGRTFTSGGGQNMIEPCLCGVATVVGPQTQNFRPVMADLLAADAVVQLNSAALLEPKLAELLTDTRKRGLLGENAKKAVLSRRGSVSRCVIAVRDAIG